jgi:hypothetical protein
MIEYYTEDFDDTELMFEGAPVIDIVTEDTKLRVPNKVIKCPVCRKPFTSKEALENHVLTVHPDLLPDGMGPAQFIFNIRNKKDHGTCTVCRINKTEWDPDANRYNRFCSPECRNKYILEAKKRMMDVYGKTHLLDSMEHQKKMLEGRRISGTYTFESDNTKIPYTGTYELDFLRFCDQTFGFGGKDIISCPHTFEYTLSDGSRHGYMPDFFLPNFGLIVEIKDGGDNPNKNPQMQLTRDKVEAKDEVMKNQKEFSYIRITNKEYSSFIYLIKVLRSLSLEDPEIMDPRFKFYIVP